jgi:hypothetical protein
MQLGATFGLSGVRSVACSSLHKSLQHITSIKASKQWLKAITLHLQIRYNTN